MRGMGSWRVVVWCCVWRSLLVFTLAAPVSAIALALALALDQLRFSSSSSTITTRHHSHQLQSSLKLGRIILIDIWEPSRLVFRQLHPGTCSYVASYRIPPSSAAEPVHRFVAYASAAQHHCISSCDSLRVATLYRAPYFSHVFIFFP